MTVTKAASIDEYIVGFPSDTQKVMQQIRAVIKNVVPDAEETISYAIPTFTLNGKYLVYFAGFKKHIGFYPAPVGIEEFKDQLSGFKTGKGSVQFPLDSPMPLDLIRSIVKFRKNDLLKKQKKPV